MIRTIAGSDSVILNRIFLAGMLCGALSGCWDQTPYWRADENIPLFGALTKKPIDCKHFKWRNNADKGRGYEYSVRCTQDGKEWTQYEVVPVSGSVTPSPAGIVDPHPEYSKTFSLYDADTAYRLAQNQPSQAVTPSTPELSQSELKTMIAALANLNGLLCAEVREVHPLKAEDVYEVTCLAYRGSTATKAYVLDAKKGAMWAI